MSSKEEVQAEVVQVAVFKEKIPDQDFVIYFQPMQALETKYIFRMR